MTNEAAERVSCTNMHSVPSTFHTLPPSRAPSAPRHQRQMQPRNQQHAQPLLSHIGQVCCSARPSSLFSHKKQRLLPGPIRVHDAGRHALQLVGLHVACSQAGVYLCLTDAVMWLWALAQADSLLLGSKVELYVVQCWPVPAPVLRMGLQTCSMRDTDAATETVIL